MNRIRRTKSLIAISIAVVTFVVFLPSLQNEFVSWDDDKYVYDNPLIRSFDIQLLQPAFTRFYASNWHPLTWLSHALDFSIWGLNPLGHHLTNNILHAFNTVLVTLIVMKLLDVFRKTNENQALSSFLNDRTIIITGAVTGLLFGLHPLHVESVAWVSERKDLLCAFFFLLSSMTYIQYASEIDARASINLASRFFNKKYVLALVFFILSLLSKPMAVTLPFVLLMLDWHPLRRIESLKAFWTASLEKLPFLALALTSSILTILAQDAAIKSLEDVPLASRMIIAGKAPIAYLMKMILPLDLVPFYPYPQNISLHSLEYIMPIIILIAITAACIAVMRKGRLWISVWGYYLITLIPVLGIVQVGDQSMADRYTYLPSIGLFLVIGLIVSKVYQEASTLRRWGVMAKMTILFVGLMITVTLSYITIKQIGTWKNSEVLWNYIIHKEPGRVPIAHYNLALFYAQEGQIDMAIEQFQTALRLKPDFAGAHLNLGLIYLSNGSDDLARTEFEMSLKIEPNDQKAWQMLNYIVSK